MWDRDEVGFYQIPVEKNLAPLAPVTLQIEGNRSASLMNRAHRGGGADPVGVRDGPDGAVVDGRRDTREGVAEAAPDGLRGAHMKKKKHAIARVQRVRRMR
jgi:hypothetical protein